MPDTVSHTVLKPGLYTYKPALLKPCSFKANIGCSLLSYAYMHRLFAV